MSGNGIDLNPGRHFSLHRRAKGPTTDSFYTYIYMCGFILRLYMKCTAIIHSWWLNWVGREAGFEPLVFAGMGVCDGGPVCTGEDWWETSSMQHVRAVKIKLQ